MSDHDEKAELYRDKLIARARKQNGAAWDAAVNDPTARVKMVEEAELLLRIEKRAVAKRGITVRA